MKSNFFSRLLKRRSPCQEPPGSGKSPEDIQVIRDEDLKNKQVSVSLDENLKFLEKIFKSNIDAVFREFNLGPGRKENAFLVYLKSLTDEARISEDILKPLMLAEKMATLERLDELPEVAGKTILTAAEVRLKAQDMHSVVREVLCGGTAVFVQGCRVAMVAGLKQWPQRPVEKSDVESTVRGPKESFTETIGVNTSLVRRRLRTPNLVLEGLNLGRMTNTPVCIAYLKGVVSPDLLTEVRRRIGRIDIDGVLESGYIEELVQDDPYSPFPQLAYTERPDRVVAALLQGRVCVFTDGTPMVLYLPATLDTMLQNPEDYYERFYVASAIRILRFSAVLMALLLPSFYVAVVTFHQEMIPTQLLISIAASREGTPFPAVVEAVLMEITFEALREAGLRLPRAVGQAISIVGGLVIGQAAVQAGIVSSLMVIVVAVTGIASFMLPSYSLALTIRLIRFPLMLLAATLGLFGVMTGVLAILIHLAGLRSFGVPYLAPLAPLKVADLKDYMIRAPWWAMGRRPSETVKKNVRRMAPDLKPHPPSEDDAPGKRAPGDAGGRLQTGKKTGGPGAAIRVFGGRSGPKRGGGGGKGS